MNSPIQYRDDELEVRAAQLCEAVDASLLARAELHRARLNHELDITNPAKLGEWLHLTPGALVDGLDDLVAEHNPYDPDQRVAYLSTARYLKEVLEQELSNALHDAARVATTCSCCRAAYTRETWTRLPLVGVDECGPSDGYHVEKRNCGCRPGGATLAIAVPAPRTLTGAAMATNAGMRSLWCIALANAAEAAGDDERAGYWGDEAMNAARAVWGAL